MPTKPNRAGQQQNYVPKGNGDASGEYGDNATGSNKHFTAFKQPDKTENKPIDTPNKAVEPPKEEVKVDEQKPENKYLGGSKEKSDFYVSLITSGIHSSKTAIENEEDFKKALKESIAKANIDAIETIQIVMDKAVFEFTENRFNSAGSYYYPAMRQMYIDKKQFDNLIHLFQY